MSFKSHDTNPEWKFVLIGRGSFATVSILSGRPVAFKHVIFSDRTPELNAEFEALCRLYDFCDTDAFLAIPRPLAYYDPAFSESFVSLDSSPIQKGWSRARRPLVAEGDFKALKLDSAAYAMDQVLSLPLSTAHQNCHLLFWFHAKSSTTNFQIPRRGDFWIKQLKR